MAINASSKDNLETNLQFFIMIVKGSNTFIPQLGYLLLNVWQRQQFYLETFGYAKRPIHKEFQA